MSTASSRWSCPVRLNGAVRLTKAFGAGDYARALESWGWLVLDGKRPVFTSLFGDVFLEAEDGWWFLDHLEGTLTRPWVSRAALEAGLGTDEGADQYLLGGLAMAADRGGLQLAEAEVYSFIVPPVLGGAIEMENVDASDFVVAINIAGQLHDQVRGMQRGTSISGIALADDDPSD